MTLGATTLGAADNAGIEVQAMDGAHAGVAAAVQCACFAEDWGADAIVRLLAGPGAFGFVAAEGPAPIGFILCRGAGDESEILTLAVLDDGRRRGVGTRLLTAALARATEHGARRMVLEVAVDNAAARGLYATAGFTAVGHRRRYYERPGGGRVDALVLARDLSPPE